MLDIAKNSNINNTLFIDGNARDRVDIDLNAFTQKAGFMDRDGHAATKNNDGSYTLDSGRSVVKDPAGTDTYFYKSNQGNITPEKYEGNIYKVYDTSYNNDTYHLYIDLDIVNANNVI